MENEKFESIVNNSINGNLSGFRNAVKKLTKLEILELIEFTQSYGVSRHTTINKIRLALEY